MQSSLHDSQSSNGESSDKRALHLGLIDWAAWVLGQGEQVPATHHRLLLQYLEAVSRGDVDRLMVLMPPGSAKSTYGSLLFPAWWFTRHPHSSVIATAHTRSLAENFGRQVRELAREFGEHLGYRLYAGKQAAGHWQTSTKGDYFASGIRGPLAGRRADLIIIDDPIKSQAEADSPLLRERLWNWYRFDLTTRLRPRGRIVLIMARWHEDDLAGRLLASNAAEWQVVRLPALAAENDQLERPVGTPLWPEWEDEAALLRRRNTVGEKAWFALFQQDPRPIFGGLFQAGHIDVLDAAPAQIAEPVVRAWDLAATVVAEDNAPDWTVGVKLARDDRGRFIVLDVVRFRGGPHDLEATVVDTAKLDGRSVIIGLPQDPGQSGKHQVSYLARLLGGYHIHSSPERGAKATRAAPVASQVEMGNVAMVRGSWNYAFLDELGSFPTGRNDDQVDALTRAFDMLFDIKPARRIDVPFLTR